MQCVESGSVCLKRGFPSSKTTYASDTAEGLISLSIIWAKQRQKKMWVIGK